MTVVTGAAHVLVIVDFTMIIVRVSAVMLVALRTIKRREVGRRGVTFYAIRPLIAMGSRINWEVLGIVIPIGRSPSR